MPSGPGHDPNRRHLQVICNDTDPDGRNLIVGIASYTNDLCDQTCVLLPHDHPWLRHKSYVLYRYGQIVEAATLQRGVESGQISVQATMNAQAFLRLVNGICRSLQTPRKIKVYFGC